MIVANLTRAVSPIASARAACRLHRTFQRLGAVSHLLTVEGGSTVPDAVDVSTSPTSHRDVSAWEALERDTALARVPGFQDQRFSLPGPGYDVARHPIIRQADVVLLHDVVGFVSPESLEGLHALGRAVVWSLPDCRPFTGGCDAIGACTGYQSTCSGCPLLVGDLARLPSRAMLHILAHAQLPRVTVVAPGAWYARRARLSRLMGASRVTAITPSVDTATYSPELRVEARRRLGLRPDQIAVFVDLLSQLRPGRTVRALSAAMARIPQAASQAAVVMLGGADRSPEATPDGVTVLRTPAAIDEGSRAAFVAAADLLVVADGEVDRPDVLLEAIACGVPIVAERGGCAADLIADGTEGWLFEPGEAGMAAALALALSDARERERRGQAARSRHLVHLHPEREAREYLALFDELLRGELLRPPDRVRMEEGATLPALPSSFLEEHPTVESLSRSDELGQRANGAVVAEGMRADPPPATPPWVARGRWPRSCPPGPPLPPTAPRGAPWPRISIVSPSFNQGEFIEETILSVANQRYPNVEHLVIDAGSTDGTSAVLQRHRRLLTACRVEADAGQSHAINKGMALASGEILTWVNSDDALAPGALAAVALAFQDPAADLVAGICEVYAEGRLLHRHLSACRDGPLPLEELLDLEGHWHPGQFFYQPEVFFRRELWERAGGFVDGSLRYSMDYDLWVRFARCGARLHVIGRPLAHFRSHAAQKTASPERFRPELERVAARHRASLAAAELHSAVPPPPAAAPGPRSPRLRVVMVNDVGFRYGAGIAHARLAGALALAGHEVLPLAVWDDNLAPGALHAAVGRQLYGRLEALAPDVVVMGNVHSAHLGPEVIGGISRAWPTIAVQHDCWLLTGRCAYPGPCAQHLSSGGCDHRCPTATEHPALDPARIADAWRAKRALRADPAGPTLVANGRWMAEEIRRTDVALGRLPREVPVLRLGLPLDVFKPRDPTLSRELLGLPQDRFIVLFSATGLSDRRKGLPHLLDAFHRAHLPDALLVGMGWVPPEERDRLHGVHLTGYVDDDLTRALIFSAADLMVTPSLHEAFGQVLVEAAACGTPSVAYAVGGIPEALADGVTGVLVPEVDPQALAAAIRTLHDDPALRRALGTWGRIHVENEFSTEQTYRDLFHAIQATLGPRGGALPPKLSFVKAASPPHPEYLIPPGRGERPSGFQVGLPAWAPPPYGSERVVHQYFVDRLAALRARRLPWILSPAAWHARFNRQLLRRELARRGGR